MSSDFVEHPNGMAFVAIPLEGLDPRALAVAVSESLGAAKGYTIVRAGIEAFATNPPKGHALVIVLKRGP